VRHPRLDPAGKHFSGRNPPGGTKKKGGGRTMVAVIFHKGSQGNSRTCRTKEEDETLPAKLGGGTCDKRNRKKGRFFTRLRGGEGGG